MKAGVSRQDQSREVLALADVTKSYGPHQQRELLHRTNIGLHQGGYVSVMGRSGSGKTTLLNPMGLLDTPTQGSVAIDGVDASAMKDLDRSRLRRDSSRFRVPSLQSNRRSQFS